MLTPEQSQANQNDWSPSTTFLNCEEMGRGRESPEFCLPLGESAWWAGRALGIPCWLLQAQALALALEVDDCWMEARPVENEASLQ
jgi:hypothetical protein